MSSDGTGPRGATRRRFLEWAATTTVAAGVASGSQGPREPRPSHPVAPFSETVEHVHFLNFDSVRRQVARFHETDDPAVLYNPALTRRLERNPDQDALDLIVRTVGEQSVVDAMGPIERTIHGWRPRQPEVEVLSRFGDVGFVGSVASTTVTLRNVPRASIPDIAALPFVLEVNWDPPLNLDPGPAQVSAADGATLSELTGSEYFGFSDLPADASIPPWLKIGIVDRGYGDTSDFEQAYAEAVGIDEDLAMDFTGEDEWRNDDRHGTNVANICAAMLQSGNDVLSADHEGLIVPLKVVPTGHTPSRLDVRDNLRSAIEYAERHGISVLNISLGTSGMRLACPSAYCPELYRYTHAGYVPFAAVGNRNTKGVQFPGGEWFTIGVGGIGGTCAENANYERYVGEDEYFGSSYGRIWYHDPLQDETHCHICRAVSERLSRFAPNVYGSYLTQTGAGTSVAGTSFASPQAAAAGALVLANGCDNHEEVTGIFREMDRREICPDETALGGQLLDAVHAYEASIKAADDQS